MTGCAAAAGFYALRSAGLVAGDSAAVPAPGRAWRIMAWGDTGSGGGGGGGGGGGRASSSSGVGGRREQRRPAAAPGSEPGLQADPGEGQRQRERRWWWR
jgi:hypothetical protein